MIIKLYRLIVVLLAVAMAGCSSQSMKSVTQTITGSESEQELAPVQLDSSPISIIIPNKNYKNVKDAFEDTHFPGYRNGGKGRYDALKITELADGITIERRTDNGTIGSGIKYYADAKLEDNALVITLKRAVKYQQGLFGKFPVPRFTEEDALNVISTPNVWFDFEIDSEFDKASVDANFTRLAKKSGIINRQARQYYYVVDLDGREVLYLPESYPYRGGTKVSFKVKIPGKLDDNNKVNFENDLEAVKDALNSIVNS